MGLTGTFEGYVPIPQDLYLRGNNIAGFQHYGNEGKVNFDSGQITITTEYANSVASIAATFSIVGYNYLNIESYVVGLGSTSGGGRGIYLYYLKPPYTSIAFVGVDWQATGNKTFSLNIGAYNISSNFRLEISHGNINIYRIWLS